MPFPLEGSSVLDKISRAEEHAQSIENEIRTWIDSAPYRLVRECNSDRTRYSSIIRVDKEPDLIRWSLCAGDCVHNLRSALDHLVYLIAIHETKRDPPADERRLQFPITDCPSAFADQERRRLNSLSPHVRAAIQGLQPYHRTHQELPPLLAVLRELDDADKHRLINVAIAQPTRGEFRNIRNLIPEQLCRMEFHIGALIDGTEIAALMLDRPTPNVRYDYYGDAVIAIRHATGPKGHDRTDAVALLKALITEVKAVIESLAMSVL